MFLFTFSLAAPIAMQCCFHSSDITSFLAQEEVSKTDTIELETEKITEKVLATIKPLKPQESKKKNLETGAALWKARQLEQSQFRAKACSWLLQEIIGLIAIGSYVPRTVRHVDSFVFVPIW